MHMGVHVVGQLVEALCYKPDGCGFDSRWGSLKFFRLHNPSGRNMVSGLTQSLTEMSTRNIVCRVRAAGA